jgi:3-hydroxyisobutyrate dehydrogenase
MLKELKLAHDAAVSTGAATPPGPKAAALYDLFAQTDHGGTDFSGIVNFLRAQSDLVCR